MTKRSKSPQMTKTKQYGKSSVGRWTTWCWSLVSLLLWWSKRKEKKFRMMQRVVNSTSSDASSQGQNLCINWTNQACSYMHWPCSKSHTWACSSQLISSRKIIPSGKSSKNFTLNMSCFHQGTPLWGTTWWTSVLKTSRRSLYRFSICACLTLAKINTRSETQRSLWCLRSSKFLINVWKKLRQPETQRLKF